MLSPKYKGFLEAQGTRRSKGIATCRNSSAISDLRNRSGGSHVVSSRLVGTCHETSKRLIKCVVTKGRNPEHRDSGNSRQLCFEQNLLRRRPRQVTVTVERGTQTSGYHSGVAASFGKTLPTFRKVAVPSSAGCNSLGCLTLELLAQ